MRLTQARLKELLRYENGELIWIKTRGSVHAGEVAGNLNSTGYVRIRVDGKMCRRSHLVWLYFHGSFPVNLIDHINGIKTDDEIENLREATNSENQQNRKGAQKNSKTEKLGVVMIGDKFGAQIRTDGTRTRLGIYDTKEEAHEAYIAEKRKRHPFGTL